MYMTYSWGTTFCKSVKINIVLFYFAFRPFFSESDLGQAMSNIWCLPNLLVDNISFTIII